MTEAYKAKWILTASQEGQQLYENSVLIVDNGKIFDIIPYDDNFDEKEYETYIDFGKSVITPGFVNLYTQLQYTEVFKLKSKGVFSLLKRFFISWHKFFSMLGTPKNTYAMHIADIEKEYLCLSKKDKIKSFKSGLKQILLSGTTCFVQVSNEKNFFEILNKLPIKTFILSDLYADTVENSKKEYKKFKKRFIKLKKSLSDSTYLGVYPHSIWSVNKVFWRYISKFAKINNLILMSELFESQQEVDWFNKTDDEESGLDFYNLFLGNKKVTIEKNYNSPVEILKNIKGLKNNVIIKNGNYLSSKDLELMSQRGVKFAYSPRVNNKVFNKSQPISNLQKYFNENFGFSTGYVPDNDDFSVLNEMCSQNFETPIEEMIKYITLYPSKILGIGNITGSIEIGKHADFNVFKLSGKQNFNDIKTVLYPSDVYIQGKNIVKDKKLITKHD